MELVGSLRCPHLWNFPSSSPQKRPGSKFNQLQLLMEVGINAASITSNVNNIYLCLLHCTFYPTKNPRKGCKNGTMNIHLIIFCSAGTPNLRAPDNSCDHEHHSPNRGNFRRGSSVVSRSASSWRKANHHLAFLKGSFIHYILKSVGSPQVHVLCQYALVFLFM